MSTPKPISMHIHSFSLRFQFRYRDDFDVFSFIAFAKAHGFTGVNISANGPGYRDLGGTMHAHFQEVNAALLDHQMGCELDTSDTRAENLSQMLDVAHAIGADQLRVYTKYQGALAEMMRWTVRDLKAIAPKAADLGITIVLENHEDFQGVALAQILAEVNHPNIRALYDYGNSQMVGEEPLAALEAMIEFITAVHIKDHVIIEHQGQKMVQGVPIGTGLLPIMTQTERLFAAGLRRFCFENVWGYVAPIVAGYQLPPTPPFSTAHAHRYLDAARLPKQDALQQELDAFYTGWNWLQHNLEANDFMITAV